MYNATVAVCKNNADSINARVRRAVALLGGIEKFIHKGDTVLIKPNATGPASFEKGVTTHPEVVEAVLQLAMEAQAGRILIGDGTGSATLGTLKVFASCGYLYLSEKYADAFTFVDLNTRPKVSLPVQEPYVLSRIDVIEDVLDCDVLINLPVLKTHFITEVSLCMKNLKGCIPPAQKRRMHEIGVNKSVADLNSLLTPTLNIVDGVIGSEGLGPKEGHPVGAGLIIAGADAVAVDAVCCDIMGFDAHKIEHIALTHARGKGVIDLDKIEVLGESLKEVHRPFAPAIPKIPSHQEARILNGGACSGCISCAVIAQSRLLDSGMLELLKKRGHTVTFAIGPKLCAEDDWGKAEDTFIIGNCARKMQSRGQFLSGCAPACLDINRAICAHYGLDDSALETLIGDVDK